MSEAKKREKNSPIISGDMIAKSITSVRSGESAGDFSEKDALAHLIIQQESMARTLQHMRKEQKKQSGQVGCTKFASLCKQWASLIVSYTSHACFEAYSIFSACSATSALESADLESGEVIYAIE